MINCGCGDDCGCGQAKAQVTLYPQGQKCHNCHESLPQFTVGGRATWKYCPHCGAVLTTGAPRDIPPDWELAI